jgi:hypothetical protein
MNFDSFLKQYGVEAFTHSVVMERETLLHMLTDLYTEAYNDGAAGEKMIRLEIDR